MNTKWLFCKTLLALAATTMITHFSHGQITVNNNDMPSPGDKKRVSIGMIMPGINLNATGANHLWDFSNLQWISQDVDTFLSISQTGATYQIVFANVPFNPNRANVATKSTLQAPPVGGISISDVLAFYYNSSSSFKQVGYGAGINGFPTPIPFNNHDIIYSFPLNFGNIDSSNSDFSVSIPGLGYYGYNQKRVNVCDGWGTLITPFGQFNVLRVRSTITARDTFYLDTLGLGFGFNRPLSREYKWLGKNHDIPLLQINTTVGFGNFETITLIRYQDSLRTLDIAGLEIPVNLTVYPNPASEIFTVEISIIQPETVSLLLMGVDGRIVCHLFEGMLSRGMNRLMILPGALQLPAGLYQLQLRGNRWVRSCRVQILSL
jgi:hypothetical protein